MNAMIEADIRSLEARVERLEGSQNEDASFKVGDRIVVAHAAYKKYAGRMGCVSSVGHTAQGVVQYSVDFDGEDCTVYFFPADELRHVSPSTPFPATGNTPSAENLRGTKGDGVVVASLQKERDEARETAYDLAVELKDTQIELAGSLWRRTNLARRHEYLKKDRDDWQLRALKAESDVTNAELELERARSSQRIDPARAGLSRGVFSETSEPYNYQKEN